jgi:hypothetical protein
VTVTGHVNWENWDTYGWYGPWFEWSQFDLATGTGTWHGDGAGSNASGTYDSTNWDPRNDYERWLDGSGSEPLAEPEPDDDGGLPDDGYYPSNPNLGDGTWTAWFAGQRGDSFDKGLDFGAGFADGVTMNASWAFRNQMLGVDTTDYDNGYYSTGGWTAFAVQLPGAAVTGVKTAVTGVKSLVTAANSFDDVGRCANLFTRLVQGGCFVPGTLVSLSELPRTAAIEAALWSTEHWQADIAGALLSADEDRHHAGQLATATARRLQRTSPLGARVPTKNPKPWEFDDSLPEPVQDLWVKLSITVERTDGGVVDAELLRPLSLGERPMAFTPANCCR